MPAHDVRRLIALDALRADVPRDDVARWIEQDDRVVLDAVHEQRKRSSPRSSERDEGDAASTEILNGQSGHRETD